MRLFFGRLNRIEKTCRGLYEKYLPRPFYSAVLDGCIEQGKDCRQWAYPSSVHDICIIIGITNVADSITAIKKVVFEDRAVTMDRLLEALEANWEGYDDVRQLVLRAPKYGNDDDYADDIAVKVHHGTSAVLAEFTDRFGNPCRGDGSGVSATYGCAFDTPATPDGRFAGQPFADATLSPIQGMDRNGPTAVLKSASKIDTTKTYNHLLNQKFLPSSLEGDMKDVFVSYLRSWGDLNVSHVQFNVVDRDTLVDAQAHPEKYPDLIVRVGRIQRLFRGFEQRAPGFDHRPDFTVLYVGFKQCQRPSAPYSTSSGSAPMTDRASARPSFSRDARSGAYGVRIRNPSLRPLN